MTISGQILVSRTADASRRSIENVPVYAGTTRTCVSTCARGAGIHRTFCVHTEAFCVHTEAFCVHTEAF